MTKTCCGKKKGKLSKTHYTIFVTSHEEAVTPTQVFQTLATPLILHELGWKNKGYVFTMTTDEDACDISVTLTPNHIMKVLFPDFQEQKLSVCNMTTRDVFINELRWNRDIPDKSESNLVEYRSYVLNHEIGHALGFHHDKCKLKGEPAPIMLQQTLGLGGCVSNPFP